MVESVESEEIMSYISEWKINSDQLFVTCLNCDSEYKIEKPITNYLDFFINTSFNHISIRSCLESQLKNNIISNSDQLFNTKELSPIIFGVILPANPLSKNSKNSQNNPETTD